MLYLFIAFLSIDPYIFYIVHLTKNWPLFPALPVFFPSRSVKLLCFCFALINIRSCSPARLPTSPPIRLSVPPAPHFHKSRSGNFTFSFSNPKTDSYHTPTPSSIFLATGIWERAATRERASERACVFECVWVCVSPLLCSFERFNKCGVTLRCGMWDCLPCCLWHWGTVLSGRPL